MQSVKCVAPRLQETDWASTACVHGATDQLPNRANPSRRRDGVKLPEGSRINTLVRLDCIRSVRACEAGTDQPCQRLLRSSLDERMYVAEL